MTARLGLALHVLLAVGGCAATRPAPRTPANVLSFPSELPADAALGLARNTLRRSGWPVEAVVGDSLSTGWRETAAGPIRLTISAATVDGGASTVVRIHGEVRVDGEGVSAARPDVPDAAAWAVVEAAAQHVGAEVRYARP